jgi:hypothetical protein
VYYKKTISAEYRGCGQGAHQNLVIIITHSLAKLNRLFLVAHNLVLARTRAELYTDLLAKCKKIDTLVRLIFKANHRNFLKEHKHEKMMMMNDHDQVKYRSNAYGWWRALLSEHLKSPGTMADFTWNNRGLHEDPKKKGQAVHATWYQLRVIICMSRAVAVCLHR